MEDMKRIYEPEMNIEKEMLMLLFKSINQIDVNKERKKKRRRNELKMKIKNYYVPEIEVQ